jgi:hypothetical protein
MRRPLAALLLRNAKTGVSALFSRQDALKRAGGASRRA